jgi:hypothetical protein
MSEQEAVKEAVEGQELSAEGKSRFGTKEKLIKDLTAKLEESKDLEAQSVKLREQADRLAEENPEEAEKLRAEAGELEAKAKKLIKTARRSESCHGSVL